MSPKDLSHTLHTHTCACPHPASTLQARWLVGLLARGPAAAKEAFSKAIGLGIRWPMTWRACEILNLPSGQPQIVLSGELAPWFAERRLQAHVTVTDESDYVAAFVVVERQP